MMFGTNIQKTLE